MDESVIWNLKKCKTGNMFFLLLFSIIGEHRLSKDIY